MTDEAAISWRSSSRTDVGMVREINEDACLDRPDVGLWVVADGMGGHTAGDVASGMICESLNEVPRGAELPEFIEEVERRLVEVNAQLREMASTRETQTVGSTVAALVAHDRHAVCVWAGDSRVYRCRGGQIVQVTQDHALVEELVEKGVLTRAQAASHPQGNLVTRAVGATDNLKLDMEIVELQPGDVFVLCSDGLDKELDPDEILEVVERDNDRPLSDMLVDLALSRGSRDNVTVVTVHIGNGAVELPAGPDSQDEPERHDEIDSDTTIPRMPAGNRSSD
jgi:protein phosphatase